MSLKQFNESFKKLYEGIDVEKENMLESDIPVVDQLRGKLSRVSSELKQSGNYNIKAYEVAFQDAIEDIFPDNAWWEVIDLDIFTDLFSNRDPHQTIDNICSSIKAEFKPQVVEEAMEANDAFDLNSDIYRAIANVILKYNTKGITVANIEQALDNFMIRFTDDDMLQIEECLSKLNEAEMSDEDKHDSELIRSMLDKMKTRSNAAFTPEEKAVMSKYGITRDNNTKSLSVDGRDLNRDVDTWHKDRYFYNTTGYDNGDEKKINYADRARKLPQRKDSQIFTGPWTVDNDQINTHGYNKTKLKNLQDAQRYAQDIPMRDKMTSMKNALRDRKYYQSKIDNADDERAKKMAKAQADFDKAKANADQWYKWDTEDASKSRDYHQKTIDKLLKREKSESLNEETSLEAELANALAVNGLELNPEECTLESAVEYIEIARSYGVPMSVEEWVRETKNNYPECFLK